MIYEQINRFEYVDIINQLKKLDQLRAWALLYTNDKFFNSEKKSRTMIYDSLAKLLSSYLSVGDTTFLGNHVIVSLEMTGKENADHYLVIIVMAGLILIVTLVSFLETLNIHNIHFRIKKPDKTVQKWYKMDSGRI